MTSEERRQGRFLRRKAEREEKRKMRMAELDDFDKAFSYGNLYEAYRKSRRNVAWKSSVQKYITQAPLLVNRTYEELHSGEYHSDGFCEFNINERGKIRHIRSVTIHERVVQRCLCDNALVPALSKTFIYDNDASLKGKGYHFAVKRLCGHLRQHYRKHGTDGYILLFDFSKFFDRIPHDVCKEILRKNFTNERIVRLSEHFIDCFGNIGLGLGSQISQILALACPNKLDHAIKEKLRIKGYGRYMDDGYLIHKNKDYLKLCLKEIQGICSELGIVLNPKKTQIVKISHGFTWLKCRFWITETGRIIKKIHRKSVTRQRRKLKIFRWIVAEGKMTERDVRQAFQSWRSYARNFNAWHTIQNMEKMYVELYGVYPA